MGESIGSVVYELKGKKIGEAPVTADEDVPKIKFGQLWIRMLAKFLLV